MISTKALRHLQDIDVIERLTQSLAMLDAIVQSNWEYRYYSFNARWGEGERMASMRNGQGDSWFCAFSRVGAFIKGFDHEAQMSPWRDGLRGVWPGVLGQVPEAFKKYLTETAFAMEETTFCIWRQRADVEWRAGDIRFPEGEDPDGSARLLAILDGQPETYRHWAEQYYERPISLWAVQHVYTHTVLTDEVVRSLNPESSLTELASDISEIGYPSPGRGPRR